MAQHIILSFSFIILLLVSHSALAAAPFCAQSNIVAPECYFYDAPTCQKEAELIGGICVVNIEAIALPEGYGNYCLVESANVAECIYVDYNSCNGEAERRHGVCIRNFTKPEPLPSYQDQPENAYQTF